jgi:hypothetical protein
MGLVVPYLSALYDDERRRTARSWDVTSSAGERFAVSMMLPLKYSLSSTILARYDGTFTAADAGGRAWERWW